MQRTEEEQQFCELWIKRQLTTFVRVGLAIIALSEILSLFFMAFIGTIGFRVVICSFHTLMLAMAICGLCLPKFPRRQQSIMGLILICTNIAYLWVFYFTMHDKVPEILLQCASLVAAAYAIFCTLTYPGRLRALLVTSATLIALAFFLTSGTDGGWLWALIYALLFPISLSVRANLLSIANRAALNDYRARRLIAPGYIVRQAHGSVLELAEQFRPRVAQCVCISSDWRNYQRLSGNLSLEHLGLALSSYYDLCQELLKRHLPNGYYYSDWIADELFVVLYAQAGSSPSAQVDQALAFAVALIQEKQVFYGRFNLPQAIDIGISYGPALVGLMGPEDAKKATALGEVPGRSRRLQSAGKVLRQHYGDQDWIIVGPECRELSTLAASAAVYELPQGEQIKDITDRMLYYLEPTPNAQSSRQAHDPQTSGQAS